MSTATNRFTGDPASDVLILAPVVRRIAREHRVGEPEARIWLAQALNFLERAATAGQMIEPSADADRAWHEFILFTRDYEQYCHERFGRFIHHEPHEGPRRLRLWDRLRGDGRAGAGCGGGVGEGSGDGGGDGGGGCGGGCGGGS